MSLIENAPPTGQDPIVERRRAIYGEPEKTFPRVAQIWSGILGFEVQAVDVPLMLIGLKLVRAHETPDYSDNSDDIAGYLAIFREIVGEDMVHARTVEDYIKLKWPSVFAEFTREAADEFDRMERRDSR